MLKVLLEDTTTKNQIKKNIYNYIQKNGPISKAELLEEFQIPQTTMSRLIVELEKKDIIKSSGLGKASGGRPPVLYDVNAKAGFFVGIEIARTHMKIVLLDSKFNMIGESEFELTETHTPEYTINFGISELKRLLEKQHVNVDLLLGIGIGAVGPLDRERGMILTPEAFLAPGWSNIPIVSMFHKEFSAPIMLNNGANTAALAEYHFQPIKEEKILYCMNGYGIRCGFITHGHSITNHEGDSSSYGHITIDINGKLCSCGNRGCLSAYTSLSAIFNTLNKSIQSVEQLLQAIQDDNQYVKKVVLESAFYYGLGIANMANTIHPDVIVLHGKLIYQYPEYYQEVLRVSFEHVYPKNRKIEIRKGLLGEKAAAIGAALQIYYHFFEKNNSIS